MIKEKINAFCPPFLINNFLKFKRWWKNKKIKETSVKQRAGVENIYHCCPQKTASQWLKSIFEDPLVYKYSGLFPMNFTEYAKTANLKNSDKYDFPQPFPVKTVVTPLYITYQQFLEIPKPEAYRAFFVMRDPRDLVVSQYFSKLKSHKRSSEIDQVRQELHQYSQKEGFSRMIDHLSENGYWDRIRSWGQIPDFNVKIVKYEHLTGKETAFQSFKTLFTFCKLAIPDEVLKEVLAKKSFEALSAGRKQGQEDQASHYRKGVAGDWQNYFDEDLKAKFDNVAGDIVQTFGYE